MTAAIEVQGLHKRYGDTVAVDDVSLDVRPGEIVGVLGRNGAGKTTTVECIAGIRRPDEGTIRVMGLDPRRNRAGVRQALGVQLQESQLHGALSVRELVRLFRSFYRTGADPDQLIATLGLHDRRDIRFDDLSGGQQQRVSIALALVGQPQVVILDELTTGLDPEARRGMWATVEAIRADGVTVVLVSHLMEEVERLCDRVAIIDRGRIIAQGSPAELVVEAGIPRRVHFRAAGPVDAAVLRALPGVESVDIGDGGATPDGRVDVTVTGSGELLQTISEALVHHRIVATGTRSDDATLDDAFLVLTGRVGHDDDVRPRPADDHDSGDAR